MDVYRTHHARRRRRRIGPCRPIVLCSAFNQFIGFNDTRSPRAYCRSLRLLHDAYRSRAAGSVLCEGLHVSWRRYSEYRRGGAELEYAMLGLETGSANERGGVRRYVSPVCVHSHKTKLAMIYSVGTGSYNVVRGEERVRSRVHRDGVLTCLSCCLFQVHCKSVSFGKSEECRSGRN